MAVSHGNLVLFGVSGALGKQFVIRQRAGKTVICKMPKPYEKPATAGQLNNRERFKKANEAAKAAIADPERKAYYLSRAKPGQSAYNVAFKEAFHGLDPVEVELDREEKAVHVKIRNSQSLEKVKVAVVHDMGFEEEAGIAKKKTITGAHSYRFKTNPAGRIIRISVYNGFGDLRYTKDVVFRE